MTSHISLTAIGEWIPEDGTSVGKLEIVANAFNNGYEQRGLHAWVDTRNKRIRFSGDGSKGVIDNRQIAARIAKKHGVIIEETTYFGTDDSAFVEGLFDKNSELEIEVKRLTDSLTEQNRLNREQKEEIEKLSRRPLAPVQTRARKPSSLLEAQLSYIGSQRVPLAKALSRVGDNLERITKAEILNLVPRALGAQSLDDVRKLTREYVKPDDGMRKLAAALPDNGERSLKNVLTRLTHAGELLDRRGRVTAAANHVKRYPDGNLELALLLHTHIDQGYKVDLYLPAPLKSPLTSLITKGINVEGARSFSAEYRSYTRITFFLDGSTHPREVRDVVNTIESTIRENYEESILVPSGGANIPLKITVQHEVKDVEPVMHIPAANTNVWKPNYAPQVLEGRYANRELIVDIASEPGTFDEIVESLAAVSNRANARRKVQTILDDNIFVPNEGGVLILRQKAFTRRKTDYLTAETTRLLENNPRVLFSTSDIIDILTPGSKYPLTESDMTQTVRNRLREQFGDRLDISRGAERKAFYALR